MTLVLAPRGLVRSPAMLDALQGLKQAVTTSGGVLLCGEVGTGRGDFARAIHLATHGGHDGTVEELLERSNKGNVNGHPLVFFACDDAHGLEQLEHARAKFIGAVLNRVDLQHNPYYYSQYYRREYSDYYQKEPRA